MTGPKREWPLLIGLALLALAGAIEGLAVGFEVYGGPLRVAGQCFSTLLGQGFSLVPVPMAELVLLAAPAVLVAAAVWILRRYGLKRGAIKLLGRLVLALGVVALVFVLGLGVQYSATPLGQTLGLPARPHDVQTLGDMTEYLLERANESAVRVNRDADGVCDFGPFSEMAGSVLAAYQRPESGLPFWERTLWPAAPKRTLLLGKAMSYLGISGFFFPWTAEAVVSADTPDFMLPITIAHEAAHALGVGAEDEANFAAFLACIQGDGAQADPRNVYSAFYSAYLYAGNALYAADYDRWAELMARRGPELARDMALHQAHLDQYATPAREVGTAVNDAYIKATGQPEGVQSYGKVVDLLLAWYLNAR